MQEVLWQPNPGRQARFLASRADEALYGGAAGGGKSQALLALPLRWVGNPSFRCLYLRREATYLGDAIDKSERLFPHLGARLVRSPRIVWTFPSGATIWLNHCEHEKDVRNYDSFEFSLVLFDELTHFTERQYLGIRARLRGTDPELPYWSRAATNPGGEGHDWVFRRWGAWLDPTHQHPALEGERRWYRGAEEVQGGTADALSRTFIPATLADNPHVGPEYRSKLLQLDPVRRAQLLGGNWLVKPAAGLYFKRTWVRMLDARPAVARARVRYWDLAAGGDWAVGVRYARTEAGLFVVEHAERLRGSPGEVRQAVKRTAELDGPEVPVWIEQDPGQAGKDQVFTYATELPTFEVRGRPKRVDKVTAFGPFSAQAEAGNVAVVRGAWNEPYFECLEGFPDGKHDDDADATSGAHAVVTGAVDRGPAPTVPELPDSDPWGSQHGF